jgi:hypothetical protein
MAGVACLIWALVSMKSSVLGMIGWKKDLIEKNTPVTPIELFLRARQRAVGYFRICPLCVGVVVAVVVVVLLGRVAAFAVVVLVVAAVVVVVVGAVLLVLWFVVIYFGI